MISFVIPIEPVAKGRPRFDGFKAHTPFATKRFENDFRMASAKYRPAKRLEGGLEVVLIFQVIKPKTSKRPWPSVRPDLDNYVKATLDALDQFWGDDGQIVRIHASKRYGKKPLIKVEISPAVELPYDSVLDQNI